MIKKMATIGLIILSIPFLGQAQAKSIYDFSFKTIQNKTISMSQFRGKKIVIINTASKCGYAPQLEMFEELNKKYAKKVVFIGFPSNDFKQELDTDKEIAAFCKKNYGVTFLLAQKTVVTGDKADPLFRWLANKSENGVLSSTISWNFNKYVIDEQGTLLAHFDSDVVPSDEDFMRFLKE